MNRPRTRRRLRRGAVLLQIALLLNLTSCRPASLWPQEPGVLAYQRDAVLAVPGGRVQLAGGNLLVERVDLSIDTRLGTHELGAVYNAATGAWLFDVDVRYADGEFVDATGARHETAGRAPGTWLEGTDWVVQDESRMRTRGGLVHVFADGRLTAVHRTSSAYPRLVYHRAEIAGVSRATEIEQCVAPGSCAPVFTLLYDARGNRVEARDRAGRSARFEYDALDRLVSARDGLDVDRGWPGFRYEYAGVTGKLRASVNSEGERIEYTYAGTRLRELKRVGEGDPRYRFFYGKSPVSGLYTTRVEDPRGGSRVFRFDDQGRLAEREDAVGEVERWAWSGRRPVRHVGRGGEVTEWSYPAPDRVRETQPSGNTVDTRLALGAENRDDPFAWPVRRAEDALGLVEERAYDPEGRLLSHTNGAGEAIVLEYDALGQILARTERSGLRIVYGDYGEHGHAGSWTLGERTFPLVYDAVGNLLSGPVARDSLDPGRPGMAAEGRRYDADRNLTEFRVRHTHVIPWEVGTVQIAHRSDGLRTSVTRPYGSQTELDYDALGRMVERRDRVDGAWRAERFEYDAADNLVAHARANGMRREWDHDAENRVVAVRLLRDGQLEQEAAFVYADGRPVSRSESVREGDELYFYDAAGRLAATVFPDGEILEQEYDARSRQLRDRYWIGGALALERSFAHDGADREIGMMDDGESVLARTFEGGLLRELRYGNGLVRSFAYTSDTRALESSETLHPGLGWVERSSVDRVGGCDGATYWTCTTAITETRGGVAATSVERYVLLHADGLAVGTRVGAVVHEAEGDVLAGLEEFDLLGNRIRRGAGEFAVFNPEHNRLLEGFGHVYEYDEAGFVTRRDETQLTWTAGGRIRTLGPERSFVWDVDGRPVASTHTGELVRFRFGGRVAEHGGGAVRMLDTGEVRVDLQTGERRYRHLDLRRNVKFVSDDAGEVVLHRQYGAFGVDRAWGDDAGEPGFAQAHAVDDLVALGARLYDPDAGRFLSPDPIRHGLNQFAYTLGNPLWFWDPDGLLSGELIGAGGAAGAIGVGLIGTGTTATLIGTGLGALLVATGAGLVTAGVGLIVIGVIQAVKEDGQTAATSGALAGAGLGGGCAPSRLANTPELAPWLRVLLGLQLVLAVVWLRRRPRVAPS
ncbi:MAG: hypothetical protein MJE66_25650 [Proteobacteria bacterium]|nr:hypothetical protein [Pseudomonadota bacterium]